MRLLYTNLRRSARYVLGSGDIAVHRRISSVHVDTCGHAALR